MVIFCKVKIVSFSSPTPVDKEPKYTDKRIALFEWIQSAESYGIPEFENCSSTYSRWSIEIINAFKYGCTDGTTEGCNNKIRVLKRVTFRLKSLHRFRNRVIHCTN